MSLLIKALDHLEKNKQADKSKKLKGEYVPDDALMLELIPLEVEQPPLTVEPPKSDAALTTSFESVEVAATKNIDVDRALTLEEEAGLTGAHIAASKYAKPKFSATKANDKVLDKATSKSVAQTSALEANAPVTPQSHIKSTATDPAKSLQGFQPVAAELNQKAAAKVFVANKTVKTPSSKSALVILGVAGALLVWLGLQGYSYIKVLTAPDLPTVNPLSTAPPLPPPPVIEQAPVEVATISPAELPEDIVINNQDAESVENQPSIDAPNSNANAAKVAEKPNTPDDIIEAEPKKSRTQKVSNTNDEGFADGEASYGSEPRSNSKRKPLKLVSKAPSSGVDPTLMAAYQAYTAGDDATAQRQYRQVLQRDVRNVDALLGMAAIAKRQGRDADAAGWYQRVLEIEPKNTIAQTASISPQASADVVGTESRIKSLLAQQPDAANLHAALGNLYAEQNAWPLAQEAYFNASRLAPANADYAFNLAIGLDQMGKSELALSQYQRALALLNKSGGASPDRATLEARIQVLQQ